MLKKEARLFIAIKQDVFILLDEAKDNYKEAGKTTRMAIEEAFCWLYPSNGDCIYNGQVAEIREKNFNLFLEGFNER